MSLDPTNWNVDPGSNTSIDGTNIAENCDAGNTNDGLRKIMAGVATYLATVPVFSTLLAKTGGTMTGNIIRSGGGAHRWNANNAHLGGKESFLPEGSANPTSPTAGDVVFFYTP